MEDFDTDHFDELLSTMTFEFIYELESLGLWEWGVYVLMFLPNSSMKENYLRKTLTKYADQSMKLEFLKNEIHVPATYIHEARAQHYLNTFNINQERDYARAFTQFCQAENYDQAHQVLTTHISP
jgi:hypothetical protein